MPTSRFTHIAQFADDTVIYMSHSSINYIANEIQSHLNEIETWATKWKIKINPSKSTAKVFTFRPYSFPTPFKMNNNIIPWTPHNNAVKYLGLHMDTTLNWKIHIDTKVQQAKAKLIQLKPLLNHRKLSLSNSIILYKTIIRPLLLYACPIWTNAAKYNINKIQIIQNKFLRTITQAPWFISNKQLHHEFNLNPIAHHIAFLANNFYSNLTLINQDRHISIGKFNETPTRIKNRYPIHSFLNIFANINALRGAR